ncbi:hypothetical protein ES703_86395 [subsurface metagenome]
MMRRSIWEEVEDTTIKLFVKNKERKGKSIDKYLYRTPLRHLKKLFYTTHYKGPHKIFLEYEEYYYYWYQSKNGR